MNNKFKINHLYKEKDGKGLHLLLEKDKNGLLFKEIVKNSKKGLLYRNSLTRTWGCGIGIQWLKHLGPNCRATKVLYL